MGSACVKCAQFDKRTTFRWGGYELLAAPTNFLKDEERRQCVLKLLEKFKDQIDGVTRGSSDPVSFDWKLYISWQRNPDKAEIVNAVNWFMLALGILDPDSSHSWLVAVRDQNVGFVIEINSKEVHLYFTTDQAARAYMKALPDTDQADCEILPPLH